MRVLIDSNVLYPTVMRKVVLGVAGGGLFEPLWSERILAEWAHVAARAGEEQAAIARAEIALVRDRWPAAGINADPGLEAGLSLPDPDDIHVLAAAIAGRAGVLLTQNLKDFPSRILARHRMIRRDPDRFLRELFARDPACVQAAAERVWSDARGFPDAPPSRRALLKKARLPGLGRLLERSEIRGA